MKKLYALALGVAVAISAAAQAPTLKNARPAVDKIETTAFAKKAMAVSPKLRANAPALQKVATPAEYAITKVNGAKKAPAKAHETDQWESIGTGQYTDFILSSLWNMDAPTFDVEIEKSLTTEGLYRIAEVYKNYELSTGLVNAGVTYDASKAEPMYIAIEGNAFIFEDFMPGLADDDGDYSVATQVGSNYPTVSVSTIAGVYPDAVGVYNNGVLTYPMTFTTGGKTYYNILLGVGDTSTGYYRGNTDEQFKIVFPGASETVEPGSVADVCGDYNLSYTNGLNGGNDYSGEMKVTAGTAENTVVFNFPFENGTSLYTLKLTGTLNQETGDIVISSDQASGFTGATVVFRHYNSGWTVIDEITAKYTGKAIVFDTYDEIMLQASSGGYYTAFYNVVMEKVGGDDPNVDPNEGWKSVGNAKFVDPWVLPGFNVNQHDYPYEVELQQNEAVSTLYRLVNPYQGNFPGASNNTCTTDGYIQFNIADPDHVTFDAVEAGFANASAGITKLYCMNTLSMYAGYLGYDADIIVEALGDQIPYTTFKNGVVTLGSIEDDGEVSYDACFGIQGQIYGGYSWTDSNDNVLDMTGSITFPEGAYDGIANIVSSDNEAPVEYFNLQGVRVSNPAAGQLVIKRQGNEVSKVLVR